VFEGSRATHNERVEQPMSMNFWMGMGAAKKSAGLKGSKSTNRHDLIVSTLVGILLAVLAVGGLLILLTNH
jgi:hypothetical protein